MTFVEQIRFNGASMTESALDAVDNGRAINPDNGKLLESIDDVIDIDADYAQQLFSKLKP